MSFNIPRKSPQHFSGRPAPLLRRNPAEEQCTATTGIPEVLEFRSRIWGVVGCCFFECKSCGEFIRNSRCLYWGNALLESPFYSPTFSQSHVDTLHASNRSSDTAELRKHSCMFRLSFLPTPQTKPLLIEQVPGLQSLLHQPHTNRT